MVIKVKMIDFVVVVKVVKSTGLLTNVKNGKVAGLVVVVFG